MIQIGEVGAGERAWQLRTLTVPPEDLTLVPSTLGSQPTVTPIPVRILRPFLGFMGTHLAHSHTQIQTHAHK